MEKGKVAVVGRGLMAMASRKCSQASATTLPFRTPMRKHSAGCLSGFTQTSKPWVWTPVTAIRLLSDLIFA
jgi:hypothetical protein